MFRVVCSVLNARDGQSTLTVDRGPWTTDEQHARQWSEYLMRTGRYLQVEVETLGQRRRRPVGAR